jgi:polysaccharide biosynthesis transport protein
MPSAGWLLERFQRQLRVQTLPRTLLIQIRFRSRDAALSAAVVNALIRAYIEQESESRLQATAQASDWLGEPAQGAESRSVDQDRSGCRHSRTSTALLSTPATLANGQRARPA